MRTPLLSQAVKDDLIGILEGPTGRYIAELAVASVEGQRRAVLTSTTLSEHDRLLSIGRVQAVHTLLKNLFEAVGMELPADLQRYFTGES